MKTFAALLLCAGSAVAAPACRPGDGRARDITCFSGGKAIYQGQSDPFCEVYLGSQDDHVSFVDRKTGRQTRVGGNCIVIWDQAIPSKTFSRQ